MKIQIIKYPDDEAWLLCKQLALVTIGKKAVTPPTLEWKKKILAASHSPIRCLEFVFLFEDLPYYVSTHLARHIHAQPYIKSQRNDRQDEYDRRKAPQDAPVVMMWLVNAEEAITISHKRLCYQADPTTMKAVQMMCDEIIKTNPEFDGQLNPLCDYRNGLCSEFNSCGRCDNFRARVTDCSDMTVQIEVSERIYRNAGRILLRQENSNYGTLYYPDGGEG